MVCAPEIDALCHPKTRACHVAGALRDSRAVVLLWSHAPASSASSTAPPRTALPAFPTNKVKNPAVRRQKLAAAPGLFQKLGLVAILSPPSAAGADPAPTGEAAEIPMVAVDGGADTQAVLGS